MYQYVHVQHQSCPYDNTRELNSNFLTEWSNKETQSHNGERTLVPSLLPPVVATAEKASPGKPPGTLSAPLSSVAHRTTTNAVNPNAPFLPPHPEPWPLCDSDRWLRGKGASSFLQMRRRERSER